MRDKVLFIDFETRSAVDLTVSGVDVYAKDNSTEIICMGYVFDDGPLCLWRLGEPLPKSVAQHVRDGGLVVAHNVSFEWNIWNFTGKKYKWPELKISQCDCTMARANAMGLPSSLDMASAAAGIDYKKDQKGRRVMLMLSQPKSNGDFHLPGDQPVKFEELYEYCLQDVRVERALFKKLPPLSERERKIWELDQKINARGVGIDLKSVSKCSEMVIREQERLQQELQDLTGNQVPSAAAHAKFKQWAISQSPDLKIESIDKEAVTTLLKDEKIPLQVKRALEIRQESAKSSTAKLQAMLYGCTDSRARFTFEYCGAKQTGRWAGRRLQLHNMPRAKLNFSDIEDAINFLPDRDAIEMLYGSPIQVASDCLRSFIVPEKNHKFLCADFSNIEGRALAWLAGEEWKRDAFSNFDKGIGRDLYILEYAKAFKVGPESVGKNERQIGKVITLAMGYGGGVGAFQNMAKVYGVTVSDETANTLKELWRNANPKIVQYWRDVEDAAKDAIDNKGTNYSVGKGAARVTFKASGSFLCVKLPSSRIMYYPYPELWEQSWVKFTQDKNVITKTFHAQKASEIHALVSQYAAKNNFKVKEIGTPSTCIVYKSYDSVTKQWGFTPTYGGSMVENLCQAISRCVLADSMLRLEDRGYPVVLHVHDEVVSEVIDNDKFTLRDFEKEMSRVPAWAEGFPIAARGYEGYRYRKE